MDDQKPTVEIKFYNWDGSLFDIRQFNLEENAFKNMLATGKDALAYRPGTTCGGYEYRARQEGHTLELFHARLEMCCNSVAEYSERLRKGVYGR